ncbi:putative glutathione S-transferase parC [Bienertia sinuspersici]
MSDELILLQFWSSPYAARVKIALFEKGLQYESKHEDVVNAKSSLLCEMNPIYKKVPVLIHNEKPICESLVIVEYIDQVWKHKSPTLLPVDPYDKAQARFWADYNDKTFFNCIRKIWRQKGEIEEEEKNEFINSLKLLEGELGDKPYFGGDTFGLLDIALIPNYSWFYTYQTCTKLSIEDECPKLSAWAQRCIERNSVKESLPNEFEIYKYALELKKKFGND